MLVKLMLLLSVKTSGSFRNIFVIEIAVNSTIQWEIPVRAKSNNISAFVNITHMSNLQRFPISLKLYPADSHSFSSIYKVPCYLFARRLEILVCANILPGFFSRPSPCLTGAADLEYYLGRVIYRNPSYVSIV